MHFLVVSKRKLDTFSAEDFTSELLEAEAQRVRELYASGVLRQIWRRGDVPGAILLFEAANVEEVREAAASLPLAARGMLEIIVEAPLVPYPGLGPR